MNRHHSPLPRSVRPEGPFTPNDLADLAHDICDGYRCEPSHEYLVLGPVSKLEKPILLSMIGKVGAPDAGGGTGWELKHTEHSSLHSASSLSQSTEYGPAVAPFLAFDAFVDTHSTTPSANGDVPRAVPEIRAICP